MKIFVTMMIGLSFLFLSACGENGVERHEVSGTATFDGQPIVFGTIQFIPKLDNEKEAPTGSATIENGKYHTDEGQGIVSGPHEIRVTAYPSKLVDSEDETAEVETVEPIFVGYSLEASIEPPSFDVIVPAEAEGYNSANTGTTSRSINDP
ncbi:hypothetical protein [Gimesia aquarii]|uniref:Carboxypeptidase regulatory-like domain-containing protein n=1 Tax=Gimesia aquarii TaxID=2527964 RepID=A0A517WYV1_9PLAN|nr:hypothetical protein [Gimesia aquarii]QDU10435.1 hypothetical protein V202x_38450 [Gimesia aquarii]